MRDKLIALELKGTRPLLMHSMPREEDSGKKRAKKVYDPQEEAEKALYKNSDGVISLPALHFEGSMIKAATAFKFEGKKTYKELFKAGVFVEPEYVPLEFDEWKIDARWVVIGRARIVRWRPRFENWKCSFVIRLTDDRIDPLVVKQILDDAGRYVGVADYRPRYGLFEIVNYEIS